MRSPFWLRAWAQKERKHAFFDTPDANRSSQQATRGLVVTRLETIE